LFSFKIEPPSTSSSSARPCTRGPANIARKRRAISTPASPHLRRVLPLIVGYPFLPLGGGMKDQNLDGVH